MKYEVPVLKIVHNEDEDIICTSLGDDGKTEDIPDVFA